MATCIVRMSRATALLLRAMPVKMEGPIARMPAHCIPLDVEGDVWAWNIEPELLRLYRFN
jgi:hypothetical protein